jgi:hypothetical protein
VVSRSQCRYIYDYERRINFNKSEWKVLALIPYKGATPYSSRLY